MATDFVETRIMLLALQGDNEGILTRLRGMTTREITELTDALERIDTLIGIERQHRAERKQYERS